MTERTYKIVQQPRGMKGTLICEFVDGQRGDEIIWLPQGTPPETQHDVVMTLQQVYKQGLADARRSDESWVWQ